jgi:rubrerythrin
MRCPIRTWLLKRVLKSAWVYERDLLASYNSLLQELRQSSVSENLERLFQEEEAHQKLLERISEGTVRPEELETILETEQFHDLSRIHPMEPPLRDRFAVAFSRLARLEEDSFVFYSNLSRISKIPVVRKAFAFLSRQEWQHLVLLRRLLGQTRP